MSTGSRSCARRPCALAKRRRRASLELFFDLAYVLVVLELATEPIQET